MTDDENKLQVLKKVEDGTLTIEEGADLLSMFDRAEANRSAERAHADVMDAPLDTPPTEVPAGWKAAWGIFMWLGVIFMGASGYWLYSSYDRTGMGWGFWFAFFFLAISAAIVYFGWKLISGRWLVVRIRSKENDEVKRIKFWAPLPINMGLWAFKNFGQYMPPEVQDKHYDQVLLDMDKSLMDGDIYVIDLDGDGKMNFRVEMGN